MTKYRILSIDALCGDELDSWEWNNWFHVGDIESTIQDNELIDYMIEEGYLEKGVKQLVEIYDDQYNIVIVVKATQRPLYAIEYGNEPF